MTGAEPQEQGVAQSQIEHATTMSIVQTTRQIADQQQDLRDDFGIEFGPSEAPSPAELSELHTALQALRGEATTASENQPPLDRAAAVQTAFALGDPDKIKAAKVLIKLGLFNINSRDAEDKTLLGAVIVQEDLASLSKKTSQSFAAKGDSMLSRADRVRELIALGADPNMFSNGRAPILHAVYEDNAEILSILLKCKGVSVNTAKAALDSCGLFGQGAGRWGTLLHYARSPEVVRVLAQAGINLESTDRNGFTALYAPHSAKVAEALIQVGVNVQAIQPEYRKQPIHLANTPEVVQLLVDHGADVNADSAWGLKPLHMNTPKGSENGSSTWLTPVGAENIRKLAALGADVNARDWDGNTPLHHCGADYAHAAMCALIESGADVNAKNKYGGTPLHHARTRETFDALVAAGADINLADNNGDRPARPKKRVRFEE